MKYLELFCNNCKVWEGRSCWQNDSLSFRHWKRLQEQIFAYDLEHISQKSNLTLFTDLCSLKNCTIEKLRFGQNRYPAMLKRYKKLCKKTQLIAWNYEISELGLYWEMLDTGSRMTETHFSYDLEHICEKNIYICFCHM